MKLYLIAALSFAIGAAMLVFLIAHPASAEPTRAEMQGIGRQVHAELPTERTFPDGHRGGNCLPTAWTTMLRLQTAGVAPSRLKWLILGGYGPVRHSVVVIDGQWVADSQSPWLEPWSAYRGKPVLKVLN